MQKVGVATEKKFQDRILWMLEFQIELDWGDILITQKIWINF